MARLVPIPGINLESYFPLTVGEKRPFANETGWFGHHPTRTLTPENYPEYESAGAEWGLRCGVFSNVIVIDQDSAKAVGLIKHLGLRSTCWAKTKRGRHDIHAATSAQLAELKTTPGLFDQVDLISTGGMVRAYALSKRIPAPALTATRFGKLVARIKEKHGNGADTWEGGDIAAGSRNATLNATLYQVAVDNPDLELRHYKLVADGIRAHMDGAMSDKEFSRTSASAWNAARTDAKAPTDLADWVGETLTQFRAQNAAMPRRVHCLGPFLTGSTAFVFGGTGHGKSFFQTAGLHAMSRGEALGPWDAGERPLAVGYIDGEQHRFDTEERFSTFINWGDLTIFHRSTFPEHLNLADPAHHEIIRAMTANLDVLAVDNFHTLSFALDPGARDYSPAVWAACQPLVAWFRDNNKLLWIADHANQQGQQQGDKTKQWNVDLAMSLDATPYQYEPALRFDVDIVKGRRKSDVKLVEFTLIGSQLVGRKRQSDGEWCQELFDDGMSRKDIEEETGFSYDRICRFLRGQAKKR